MPRAKMAAEPKDQPKVIMFRLTNEEFDALASVAADNLRSPTSQAKWLVVSATCNKGESE